MTDTTANRTVWRVCRLWLICAAVCGGWAMMMFAGSYQPEITVRFLREDVWSITIVGAAAVLVIAFFRRLVSIGPSTMIVARPWIVAILCGLFAWIGAHVFLGHYALTRDEVMALFDSRIFARGFTYASVSGGWRDYAAALEPLFRLEVPQDAIWVSGYLPVNAWLLTIAGLIGDRALSSALCAAVAVPLLFGIARTVWPDRPAAPWIATILLIGSSQFLVMAMTPYAMAAHLALNLSWLRLVSSERRGVHWIALPVAFFATGLHQLIFFPLFAAPFIIGLWIVGRRRHAAIHAGALAAILVFWTLYWQLLLAEAGVPAAASAGVGAGFLWLRVWVLIGQFQMAGIYLMGANLLRLLLWQHPLTIVLALLGCGAAWRTSWLLRAAIVGVVGTILAMYLLLPLQAHGWGYRYLHGFLGSICLIATAGCLRIWDTASISDRPRLVALFEGATIVALTVMLPLHLWQAHRLTAPYARADAAMRGIAADVVVIDPNGVEEGEDLVRNDPWLEESPKRMEIDKLSVAQVRRLCGTMKVVLIDAEDLARFGLPTVPREEVSPARREMDAIGCGVRARGAGWPSGR